ncbi:hypothetical protein [Novosphingobium sp.]|uniref:hypothetical protein n=1 Tax=Novosphingobium sp. TaxID=1874826 RepID=UPI00286DFDC1|nr:hypothetical protein [Novosphingobium sp.]
MAARDYDPIAASQANVPAGPTGVQGDYLEHLLVIPATTAPGAVSIKDGTGGTPITVFAGGTLTSVIPFTIPIYAKAKAPGGWLITTGANVSVLAVGEFA